MHMVAIGVHCWSIKTTFAWQQKRENVAAVRLYVVVMHYMGGWRHGIFPFRDVFFYLKAFTSGWVLFFASGGQLLFSSTTIWLYAKR